MALLPQPPLLEFSIQGNFMGSKGIIEAMYVHVWKMVCVCIAAARFSV